MKNEFQYRLRSQKSINKQMASILKQEQLKIFLIVVVESKVVLRHRSDNMAPKNNKTVNNLSKIDFMSCCPCSNIISYFYCDIR